MVPLALTGFNSSAAAAKVCPTSKDEIATDRPDVTDSSLVVPPGNFLSENDINLSGWNSATVFDGSNSRLRLGIAPCLRAPLYVPARYL